MKQCVDVPQDERGGERSSSVGLGNELCRIQYNIDVRVAVVLDRSCFDCLVVNCLVVLGAGAGRPHGDRFFDRLPILIYIYIFFIVRLFT